MATAKMENVGAVVVGMSKQNGQLRGLSSQSGPGVQSNPFARVSTGGQKPAADSQEGPGIR